MNESVMQPEIDGERCYASLRVSRLLQMFSLKVELGNLSRTVAPGCLLVCDEMSSNLLPTCGAF